jgi:hypothetical protein
VQQLLAKSTGTASRATIASLGSLRKQPLPPSQRRRIRARYHLHQWVTGMQRQHHITHTAACPKVPVKVPFVPGNIDRNQAYWKEMRSARLAPNYVGLAEPSHILPVSKDLWKPVVLMWYRPRRR